MKVDGNIDKYREILCVKGFRQKQDFDLVDIYTHQ